MLDTANNIMITGMTILTAANASEPTKCPTKIPSAIMYMDEKNMLITLGMVNLKKTFFTGNVTK